MKILFLSAWYPDPPTNGSKLRIYNLLRGLAERHEVTLLSFVEGEAGDGMGAFCKEIITLSRVIYNPRSPRAAAALFSGTPRSLAGSYSAEMASKVRAARETQDFELIIASELDMAVYIQDPQTIPWLWEDLELGAAYERAAGGPWARFRHGLTWQKLRRYAARKLEAAAACTVVSERERAILRRAAPDFERAAVIPNGLRMADYERVRARRAPGSIIFSGSFRYRVNYEGMRWFMREAYPLVRQAAPGARVTVTGDHGGLQLPNHDAVELTGFLPDVKQVIAAHEVSIAPVWEGSGTRLKILEAMALGTAVVSTSKGAEGLEVEDGVHLLIADKAEDFAAAVVRLLGEEALRKRLAENALARVKEKYNWEAITPKFLELVEQAAKQR